MSARRVRRIALAAAGWVAAVGLLGLLAEGVLRLLDVKTFLVPRPSIVLADMWDERGSLWSHTLVTWKEILVGFSCAATIGFGLAVLITYVPFLSRVVYPAIVASQTIPKIAIAPLLVVWFGFGLMPKIIVVFLISFFPMVMASVVGLKSVDENMLKMIRSMGASGFQAFYKVRLVNAVPSIFAGLKIGITLSVVGAIVGEFVGADAGLGYLMLVANARLDTPIIFASLLILSATGIALFGIVTLIERITPGHIRDEGQQQTFVTG